MNTNTNPIDFKNKVLLKYVQEAYGNRNYYKADILQVADETYWGRQPTKVEIIDSLKANCGDSWYIELMNAHFVIYSTYYSIGD